MSTADLFCAGHEVSNGLLANSPHAQQPTNAYRPIACGKYDACARISPLTKGNHGPAKFDSQIHAPLLQPGNFPGLIRFY